MKRWRFPAFFLALTFVLLPLIVPAALVFAQTAHTGVGLVPCGAVSASNPYVATECGLCDFGVLIQRIINYLIVLALPISAALFAWAGILLFTAGDNTENRGKAKSIFVHVMVGLLITLAGYLVVQTVLNALVQGSPLFPSGFSFSFGQCASDNQDGSNNGRPRSTPITQLFSPLTNVTVFGPPTAPVTSSGGGGGGVTGGPASTCSAANTACSAAAMQAADPTLTAAQASALSCIAVTETGGGHNTDNSSGSGCNSDGFCGTFQIGPAQNVVSGPACGGTLNCPSLCTSGKNGNVNVAGSSCAPCVQALNNVQCNAQAAAYLFKQNGYQPWTGVYPPSNSKAGQNWNPSAPACVSAYDPNTTSKIQ